MSTPKVGSDATHVVLYLLLEQFTYIVLGLWIIWGIYTILLFFYTCYRDHNDAEPSVGYSTNVED